MAGSARCKFTVIEITGDPSVDGTVKMVTQYDEEISKEDRAFSIYTPWGEMEFSVQNPALADFFKEGQAYYVDIKPVEEASEDE